MMLHTQLANTMIIYLQNLIFEWCLNPNQITPMIWTTSNLADDGHDKVESLLPGFPPLYLDFALMDPEKLTLHGC